MEAIDGLRVRSLTLRVMHVCCTEAGQPSSSVINGKERLGAVRSRCGGPVEGQWHGLEMCLGPGASWRNIAQVGRLRVGGERGCRARGASEWSKAWGGELGAAVEGLGQGCWRGKIRSRGDEPQKQELEFNPGM